MSQFLGFGDGSDGDLVISADTTEAPIDSSCSGTADSNSLSATNASFAAGQIVLIHQSSGTGAGTWELNRIASYSAGIITLELPLVNTYTDSGADQAQVRVLKQYSSITIQSGKTYTAKAWDGNVGGILAFIASGTVTITGSLNLSACGFRGGAAKTNGGTATSGEGRLGIGSTSQAANNEGGGGGGNCPGTASEGDPGGGGGHATAGSNGVAPYDANGQGAGGNTGIDVAALTTAQFGGGGGGGVNDNIGGASAGANGGGFCLIITPNFVTTGSINCNGALATTGVERAQGGSGAGGSVLIKSQVATLGTNLITAIGGSGNTYGGNGGDGRIRIEACSISGSTNPVASTVEGGLDWCVVGGFVY